MCLILWKIRYTEENNISGYIYRYHTCFKLYRDTDFRPYRPALRSSPDFFFRNTSISCVSKTVIISQSQIFPSFKRHTQCISGLSAVTLAFIAPLSQPNDFRITILHHLHGESECQYL